MSEILSTIVAVGWLEWSAMFMTAACIFLAGRNNIHTWWVGIIATILYGVLFFNFQLYADATLQVFFVITSIIGWYSWVNISTNKPALIISRIRPMSMALMVLSAIVVAAGYGMLLHTFTDAYAPGIDSFVLTFSVVGQLLLMRRKLETWPMWIIVNTVAVPLFWSRGLYPTSLMYIVFWFHAWYAWYSWLQVRKEQTSLLQPPNKIK